MFFVLFFFVNCPTTIRYDAISDSTAKMSPPPQKKKKWKTNQWRIKKLLLEFFDEEGRVEPTKKLR